tara:strand:+ start:704 stop:1792 length:1089 start_codon:yes stop_codon:yes gene_type:complete
LNHNHLIFKKISGILSHLLSQQKTPCVPFTFDSFTRSNFFAMRFSILLISLLFFGLPSEFDAQVFIDECSVFEAGPNETWTHVLTAVTAEDPESGAEQVLEINVSSLPSEGANYRVVKTVANGNWYQGNPVPLVVGPNTITVAATSFLRTVKFQFSSGAVGFDSLVLNGIDINTCEESDDGMPITECDNFQVGPNESWPFQITATTSDDPSSNEAQSLEFVVSALPDGGANYRVVKTVANGQWDYGNAMALAIGVNSISASAVSFARTVTFQFSNGETEFTSAILNGDPLSCIEEPCSDANDNGVCDDDEVDPSFYCGTGTEWNEAEGKCVALPQCTGDIDLNGAINVSDLLLFLSVFGSDC